MPEPIAPPKPETEPAPAEPERRPAPDPFEPDWPDDLPLPEPKALRR